MFVDFKVVISATNRCFHQAPFVKWFFSFIKLPAYSSPAALSYSLRSSQDDSRIRNPRSSDRETVLDSSLIFDAPTNRKDHTIRREDSFNHKDFPPANLFSDVDPIAFSCIQSFPNGKR
jgi:hypothetical protein